MLPLRRTRRFQIILQNAVIRNRHRALRRLRIHAGLEPSKNLEPDAVPPRPVIPRRRHYSLHRERNENVRRTHGLKARKSPLGHADNRHRMSIDLDSVVQHPRIAPKSPLPIFVTDHRVGLAILHPIFIRSQRPPDRGLNPENLEVIARNQFRHATLRQPLVGNIHRILIARRDPREHPRIPVAQLHVSGISERILVPARASANEPSGPLK